MTLTYEFAYRAVRDLVLGNTAGLARKATRIAALTERELEAAQDTGPIALMLLLVALNESALLDTSRLDDPGFLRARFRLKSVLAEKLLDDLYD